MGNDHHHGWMQEVKSRGLEGVVRALLVGLQPLGVLGAQFLYVIQPLSGIFGLRGILGTMAQALEDPEQMKDLLRALDDDHR